MSDQSNNSVPMQWCVEAATGSGDTAIAGHRRLVESVEYLLSAFAEAGMPVTFALDYPYGSQLAELIERHPQHEIALLATESWLRSGTSAAQLQRELQDRLQYERGESRRAINTLVLTTTPPPNWELVAEFGIDTIRQMWPRPVRSGAFRRLQQKSLSALPALPSGFEEVAVTTFFPADGNRLDRFDSAYRAKRSLLRATRKRRPQHVTIPMSRLLVAPEKHLRQFRGLMNWIQPLVVQGRLAPVTMSRSIAESVLPEAASLPSDLPYAA